VINFRKADKKEKQEFYHFMKIQDRRIKHWWEDDLMCVLEKEWKIIWFVREVNPNDVKQKISVVRNVWVHEPYRWKKLWLELVKFLINNIKSDVIWLDCKFSLEQYYNKIWFIKTDDMPEWFLSKEEQKYLMPMKLEK